MRFQFIGLSAKLHNRACLHHCPDPPRLSDEEDLADFQRSAASLPFTRAPSHFSQLSQLASTPIELAVACRLVHKALTGSQARRAPVVDAADLYRAWTSIDNCWQGFDRLRTDAQANPIVQHDDLQRFCDAWMVFLFECASSRPRLGVRAG